MIHGVTYGLSLYSHPGQGAPGAADPGSFVAFHDNHSHELPKH